MTLATAAFQPGLEIESVSGNVSGRATADATSLALHANRRAEQLAVWQFTVPGIFLSGKTRKRSLRPTNLLSEFIHGSRTAATRFTRIVFSSITTFLDVALILTMLFLVQRSQRLQALRSEYLALQSEKLVSQDSTIAFNLARKAYVDNHSNEKAQSLLRSMYHEAVNHMGVLWIIVIHASIACG